MQQLRVQDPCAAPLVYTPVSEPIKAHQMVPVSDSSALSQTPAEATRRRVCGH